MPRQKCCCRERSLLPYIQSRYPPRNGETASPAARGTRCKFPRCPAQGSHRKVPPESLLPSSPLGELYSEEMSGFGGSTSGQTWILAALPSCPTPLGNRISASFLASAA